MSNQQKKVLMTDLSKRVWDIRVPVSQLKLSDGSSVVVPKKLVITGLMKKYAYVDNKRTDTVEGYYVNVIKEKNYLSAKEEAEELGTEIDLGEFVATRITYPLTDENTVKFEELSNSNFEGQILEIDNLMARVNTRGNSVDFFGGTIKTTRA